MHQGGWDEAIMLLGPVAIIGTLIYLARKHRPDDDELNDDDDQIEPWERE